MQFYKCNSLTNISTVDDSTFDYSMTQKEMAFGHHPAAVLSFYLFFLNV